MDEPRLKMIAEISFGSQTLGAGKKVAVEVTAESEEGLVRGMREAARFILLRGLGVCPFSHNYSMRTRVKVRHVKKRRMEKITISFNGGYS
ncbi:hypothetical protein A2482_03145 [Candidatus Falkowbacteria bacterium RIFOXYC2_FULL_48_21]|uniref:Uncharacterized protein n=1 Tax=Candidatus Falkowbacteria bacterium RIFOXYC2_FULL_48_21 TaxID=1798005 RepID=A0A1F5T7Y0_9BACT|nr:MAG: hypothetical protein A2482_03145 [Candidatus Falkowbacteria bacterium RIFOXYC2_FULL_48_21]